MWPGYKYIGRLFPDYFFFEKQHAVPVICGGLLMKSSSYPFNYNFLQLEELREKVTEIQYNC